MDCAMDCENIIELPAEERFDNWKNLVETIWDLEHQIVIEDLETYRERIREYRGWVDDYSKINPEIEGEEFRQRAREAEELIRYLSGQVYRREDIDLKLFLELCLRLRYLAESALEADELDDFMDKLKI